MSFTYIYIYIYLLCISSLSVAALCSLLSPVVGLQTVPCGIHIILFSLLNSYLMEPSFHGGDASLLFPAFGHLSHTFVLYLHLSIFNPSIYLSSFPITQVAEAQLLSLLRLHPFTCLIRHTHWPLTCLLTCCWSDWSVSTTQQHSLWYLSS